MPWRPANSSLYRKTSPRRIVYSASPHVIPTASWPTILEPVRRGKRVSAFILSYAVSPPPWFGWTFQRWYRDAAHDQKRSLRVIPARAGEGAIDKLVYDSDVQNLTAIVSAKGRTWHVFEFVSQEATVHLSGWNNGNIHTQPSTMPGYFLLAFVCLALLFCILKWKSPDVKFPMPPSSKLLPIIGSLLEDVWQVVRESCNLRCCPEYLSIIMQSPTSSTSTAGTPVTTLNPYEAATQLLERRSALYSHRPVFCFDSDILPSSNHIAYPWKPNAHD